MALPQSMWIDAVYMKRLVGMPGPYLDVVAQSTSLESVDEHEFDVEAPIGVHCPSVPGHQRQSIFDGRGADESVIHGSTGDAERAQPGQELDCGLISEKKRRGKVVANETADRAWTSARRRWQPRENREGFERGMPGQAQRPVADRVDNGAMVLVISDDERHGDTGIDQRVGLESRPSNGGRRHAALAPARRRWSHLKWE